MRIPLILTAVALTLGAGTAVAQDPIAALSPEGREAYGVYSQFSEPKAFAVAADGSFGFYGGQGTLDQAMNEALRRCNAVAKGANCEVVSMNDEPMIAAGPAVAEALRQIQPVGEAEGLRRTAVNNYRIAQAPKALATSADGAWGWVAGAGSLDEARTEALRFCAEWGKNCEIAESQ